MKSLKCSLILIALLFIHTNLWAACNRELMHDKLKKTLPDVTFDDIRDAPMKGWCEISIGAEVYYLEEKQLLLFSGELVSLKSGENYSNKRRAALVRNILNTELTQEEILVIPSKNAKSYVTVFTDVDCPYCRKFHEDVPHLLEHGVEIRYLLFPRSGLRGPVYNKSVAVWCAKDRVNAINRAETSQAIEMRTCSNPVSKHYELGRKLGVTGTPTLILPDGSRIGGYIPADQLLGKMGLK